MLQIFPLKPYVLDPSKNLAPSPSAARPIHNGFYYHDDDLKPLQPYISRNMSA